MAFPRNRSSFAPSISVFACFLLLLSFLFPPALPAQHAPDAEAAVPSDPAPRSQTDLIRKDEMDEAGEEMGRVIDQAGATLAPTPLSWLNREAWMGITWLKFMTSGSLLLLLAGGVPLLRSSIGRYLNVRSRGDPQNPARMFLDAIRHPLYLVVWVCGIYWALTPLFRHFMDQNGNNGLRALASGLVDLVAILAFVWFLVRLFRLVNARLRRWAASKGNSSGHVIVGILRKAIRLLSPAFGMLIVLPLVNLSPEYVTFIRRLVALYLIGAVSGLLLHGLNAFEALILSRNRIDIADNLKARRIYTQVNVLKKAIVTVVIVLTAGSMLMVFESVRQYGTSILASAGIVSLVAGFAAQRSIAGLFAGFQIAIAQPIRLDDVVVVEGEWGRIEEITLTYVVVRIWDQRRLVLPISYFIEKPFQNWTRTNAEVLGTVFLKVDYITPVDELREELSRIVKASRHWDGRHVSLQVTESGDQALELRALASAADGPRAWDLRCEIREKLVGYIQRTHPQCLPRIRSLAIQREGIGSNGGDSRRSRHALTDEEEDAAIFAAESGD